MCDVHVLPCDMLCCTHSASKNLIDVAMIHHPTRCAYHRQTPKGICNQLRAGTTCTAGVHVSIPPVKPSQTRLQTWQQKYLVASNARVNRGVIASATDQSTVSEAQITAIDDFKTDKRPIILFDGVCNLCNSAVDFMLEYDTRGAFRMAALQSAAGRRLLQRCNRRPDDISSIVLVEEHNHYLKSEAVLRIAQKISNPWPLFALFGLPVPLFIRDVVYDQVADNRYSFMGRRNVCRASQAGFEDRFVVN